MNYDGAADANGNIYVSGLVLIKYDALGTLVWTKGPSSGGFQGIGVVVDSQNNTYQLASYYNSFEVDGQLVNGAQRVNAAAVIKRDTAGVIQWIQTFRDGECYPSGIAIDHLDNLYIAGSFHDTIFDTPYYSLVKMTSAGVIVWKKSDTPALVGVVADNSGIYLAGLVSTSNI